MIEIAIRIRWVIANKDDEYSPNGIIITCRFRDGWGTHEAHGIPKKKKKY